MVIVIKLSARLQGQRILKEISCSLLPGRITIFVGKSGAGKTTLLKALVGLVPQSDGSIRINDTDMTTLSPRQRSEAIGYVFQDFNLFPHLSVLQNCVDSLIVHGMDRKCSQQRARDVLQQVEMDDCVEKYPFELSGGQQQRVAIARALCLNPRILLLDEPTAALDPENSANIAVLLQKLAANNIAVGVASHDMIFVKQILDRGYVLQAGKIIEVYDVRSDEKISEDSVLCSFLKSE